MQDCNTYNADFDGDEMNCHFPQNDIASAESKYICATDLQYIVPTDGSPLRGLIQDHVDSGVKMTCKDTFFEKWEYQQLLFAALASLPGLEVIRMDADIEMMPPAIMKPKQLWTGKQVISTLLRHVSRGNDRDDDDTRENGLPNISVERKAKTSAVMFGEEQMEHKTLIRDGELLRGVLDKASFGHSDFSMVHAVYEAQGPAKAGLLLNALGRLFTAHLQYYSGHSCRMEDLILTKETNARRRELIQVSALAMLCCKISSNEPAQCLHRGPTTLEHDPPRRGPMQRVAKLRLSLSPTNLARNVHLSRLSPLQLPPKLVSCCLGVKERRILRLWMATACLN